MAVVQRARTGHHARWNDSSLAAEPFWDARTKSSSLCLRLHTCSHNSAVVVVRTHDGWCVHTTSRVGIGAELTRVVRGGRDVSLAGCGQLSARSLHTNSSKETTISAELQDEHKRTDTGKKTKRNSQPRTEGCIGSMDQCGQPLAVVQ